MQAIDHWQDPRLDPYRNLKDQTLRARAGRFVAEGTETIRMLLQSPLPVQSVLLKPSLVDKLTTDLAARPDIPVFTASTELLSQVVGYRIHRGALACGRRPACGDASWLLQRAAQPGPLRLLVLDAVHDASNVGGIIRSARGLGLNAVVLGPGCCDPWYRRAIRVSVGHVFHQPLLLSEDLPTLLTLLQRAGIPAYAGLLGTDSQPIAQLRTSPRWAVVVGNEDRAVSTPVAACCQAVHIPMASGVDSLNAGVSAALLAHACLLQETEHADS